MHYLFEKPFWKTGYLQDQEGGDRNTGRLMEMSQDHIQRQTLILVMFNVFGSG